MPLPWLFDVKRRSVEEDYKFFDPPRVVWMKINGPAWNYANRQDFYESRDVAFMSLEYLSTCRVSELCRADLGAGYKGSVTKDQFFLDGDLLKFREAIILKRMEKRGNGWGHIQHLEDYPKRREIPMPTRGGLGNFTKVIIKYLDTLDHEEELFKFRRGRAHQIVKHTTGEMNHYLRDMGLKLYSRLLDRNLKDLKDFSGHARVQNLMKYLGEGQLEEKVLNYA